MKQEVLVFAVSQYDFPDEKTGEKIKGTTVRYMLTDTMLPNIGIDGEKGYKPGKGSLPLEAFDTFQDVPAIYSVEFGDRMDSKGKLTLTPKSFKFVRQFAKGKTA